MTTVSSDHPDDVCAHSGDCGLGLVCKGLLDELTKNALRGTCLYRGDLLCGTSSSDDSQAGQMKIIDLGSNHLMQMRHSFHPQVVHITSPLRIHLRQRGLGQRRWPMFSANKFIGQDWLLVHIAMSLLAFPVRNRAKDTKKMWPAAHLRTTTEPFAAEC
jgi:hypothetical protein